MTMPRRRVWGRLVRRAALLQRQRQRIRLGRLGAAGGRAEGVGTRLSAPRGDAPRGYSAVGDFSPLRPREARRADRGAAGERAAGQRAERAEQGEREGKDAARRGQETRRETGSESDGDRQGDESESGDRDADREQGSRPGEREGVRKALFEIYTELEGDKRLPSMPALGEVNRRLADRNQPNVSLPRARDYFRMWRSARAGSR